ncbi:putative Lipoprotein [Candidatus Sulfopaludibacter sp. SbA3]|nr:putative Lipoprotein [Candidatus Sulfopaludibacter sp. SbA3]
MSNKLVFALIGAALSTAGCTTYGSVEQGRVIAFNKKSGQITLIRESTGGRTAKPAYDALPPISVKSPQDPDEMGPEPQAGKLMQVDLKNREMVIFDTAVNQMRTIHYTPLEERHNVAKGTGLPVIDKVKRTITIYWSAERTVVTFAASEDLLAMPADTWKVGDEVRYYFKDPAQALRMMNVSKTDLSKS